MPAVHLIRVLPEWVQDQGLHLQTMTIPYNYSLGQWPRSRFAFTNYEYYFLMTSEIVRKGNIFFQCRNFNKVEIQYFGTSIKWKIPIKAWSIVSQDWF